MKGQWVPHDTRDIIVDFIRYWVERTSIPANRMRGWIGLSAGKYDSWQKRYGMVNEHNGLIPRDFWLENWEKDRIVQYAKEHPVEGYRRLCFMMLDADVVAVSPSSVILDGYSRYVVHWEIRETMTEAEIEVILQRAHEKYPEQRPRIISDNGPQFISRDFKEYIRLAGMSHVRTSPFYPQSDGKIEHWHRTRKGECIRLNVLLSLDDARRITTDYIWKYNNERLNSAIGYIAPVVKLEGREQQAFLERDRKLETAREKRKKEQSISFSLHLFGER